LNAPCSDGNKLGATPAAVITGAGGGSTARALKDTPATKAANITLLFFMKISLKQLKKTEHFFIAT
jgi:hypothetical protein